ncbi:MAG: hypothetical protein ABL921_12250 [Pirellula sp.]
MNLIRKGTTIQFLCTRRSLTVVLALVLGLLGSNPIALANPVVKIRGEGVVEYSGEGNSTFVLAGYGSHLGEYTCYGEADLVTSGEDGKLQGEGVAVIHAANGDLLVGVVTWFVDQDGQEQIRFSWRDSVTFSDGTTVSTNGRFLKNRPAGAVSRVKSISDGTSNIIAILIG